MAISGVELQVMKQLDRMSQIKQLFKADFTGDSNSFWTLVDGAANEAYENRIKGSDMSTFDINTQGGNIGTHARQWWSLHDQYATRDLGLTGAFAALLSSWGWLLHEYSGDVYYESMSRRLATGLVFPSPQVAANTLATISDEAGGAGQVPGDYAALNSTKFGDVPLMVCVTAEQAATPTTFSIKLKTVNAEASGSEVSLTGVSISASLGVFVAGGNPHDTSANRLFVALGETTPSSDPAVDDVSLALTAVAGFVANGYLVISERLSGVDTHQLIRIASDWGGSSPVTFASGYAIRHDFTTGAKVWPCFREVVEITSVSAQDTLAEIRPIELRPTAL